MYIITLVSDDFVLYIFGIPYSFIFPVSTLSMCE